MNNDLLNTKDFTFTEIENSGVIYNCRVVDDLSGEDRNIVVAPIDLFNALELEFGDNIHNSWVDQQVFCYATNEELTNLSNEDLYYKVQ